MNWGLKLVIPIHTKGIEVPIAAVALGANVIEKTFYNRPQLTRS